MGIYDRDYYRQGRSGFRLRAPRTAVGAIILLNIAVFVLENVERMATQNLSSHDLVVVNVLSDHVVGIPAKEALALKWWQQDTLRHPWLWWQWLTCGFVHDPLDILHIVGNMAALFFLGPAVEEWYGTREFIRLYLAMLVFSSITWEIATRLVEPHAFSVSYGASGAIAGVVTLFALNFPKQALLFMMVLPMPAWLVGAIMIAFDIYGAMHRGDHVAYTAHLGGAAFAVAYYQLHWNFSRLVGSAGAWLKRRSRPSLAVFKPEEEPEGPLDEADVDRILEKIHREGENSLTRRERRIMEAASRKARERLQRPD